jgi:transcriptional regulator with XRE-family HTH domain
MGGLALHFPPGVGERTDTARYIAGMRVTAVVDEPRHQRARVIDGFAANLLAFRRIADLSQEEVAVRAGLHRTEVSLLERGGRIPRLDTIVRVAAGVEADTADLLEGLAWEIDPDGFPSEQPLPERVERIVDGRRMVWAAGGWTRVGHG